MEKMRRAGLTSSYAMGALVAALLIAGCSKLFEVSAVFLGGKLAFVGDDDEETFAPWCLNNFSISDENGEKMWEIDAYDANRSAKRCGPNLPIIYGVGPKGAKTVVAAKPLVAGHTYIIDGYGGGIYEGMFKYTVQQITKVQNLDTDNPEARAIVDRMFERRRMKDNAEREAISPPSK